MKKLLFLLVLIIGFLTPDLKAQKIDCSSTPSLPDNLWKISLNPPKEDIADFSKLKFKLIKLEEGSKITNFEQRAKVGLNACVLDYLLKNPEVIPQDFKNKNIVFTGTMFKDGGGNELYKNLTDQEDPSGKWTWGKTYPDFTLLGTYLLEVTN